MIHTSFSAPRAVSPNFSGRNRSEDPLNTHINKLAGTKRGGNSQKELIQRKEEERRKIEANPAALEAKNQKRASLLEGNQRLRKAVERWRKLAGQLKTKAKLDTEEAKQRQQATQNSWTAIDMNKNDAGRFRLTHQVMQTAKQEAARDRGMPWARAITKAINNTAEALKNKKS